MEMIRLGKEQVQGKGEVHRGIVDSRDYNHFEAESSMDYIQDRPGKDFVGVEVDDVPGKLDRGKNSGQSVEVLDPDTCDVFSHDYHCHYHYRCPVSLSSNSESHHFVPQTVLSAVQSLHYSEVSVVKRS